MESVITLFKAMSDGTRLRMLLLLHRKGPLCVCEMTDALGESQPKVSRHLADLRKRGLVDDQRQGLWVFYQIAPTLPPWMRKVLDDCVEGLAAESPIHSDLGRVRRIAADADRDAAKAGRQKAI